MAGVLLLADRSAVALLAERPAVLVGLVLVQGSLQFARDGTLIARALYAVA
ncbi:hypothetical protein ACFT8P_31590 [Streptomyces sp. NPDC057101]|uniref:hypothetical protein n=1 Tax=Streptomyces sp. NPDC057101 TaxID=3346020 RepID=UPI00363E6E34